MSKFRDLKYEMRLLISEIEDIEDAEIKNNVIKAFDKVEAIIDDIESELSSVQYTINGII
jgi:hypothetical protein